MADRPPGVGLLGPGLTLATILSIFTLIFSTSMAGEWQGTRLVKDGVVHVMNPAEPMEPPVIYELREEWRLESETNEGDLIFGVIDDVDVGPDGTLYCVDSQLKAVHLISATGDYMGSIGREGEGPGELRYPNGVFYQNDLINIVDLQAGKIVRLSEDGSPRGEWRAILDGYQRTWVSDIFPAGELYVLAMGASNRTEESMTTFGQVGIFDARGNKIAGCAEWSYVRHRGEPYLYDEELREHVRILAASPDGRIAVSRGYRGYRIELFDIGGMLDLIIERDYDPVRRSQEDIDKTKSFWEAYYQRAKNLEVDVSQYERSIAGIELRTDGFLWVMSSDNWKNPPAGVAEMRDEYDQDGRFVRSIHLRGGDFSSERDILHILGHRAIIIKEGILSQHASVGGQEHSHGQGGGNVGLPTLILCEMIQDGSNTPPVYEKSSVH